MVDVFGGGCFLGPFVCKLCLLQPNLKAFSSQVSHGMMTLEEAVLANPSDISMLLPVLWKPWYNNNNLYSWAYHNFKTMAQYLDLEEEEVKCLCRAKGNRVVELYGE